MKKRWQNDQIIVKMAKNYDKTVVSKIAKSRPKFVRQKLSRVHCALAAAYSFQQN